MGLCVDRWPRNVDTRRVPFAGRRHNRGGNATQVWGSPARPTPHLYGDGSRSRPRSSRTQRPDLGNTRRRNRGSGATCDATRRTAADVARPPKASPASSAQSSTQSRAQPTLEPMRTGCSERIEQGFRRLLCPSLAIGGKPLRGSLMAAPSRTPLHQTGIPPGISFLSIAAERGTRRGLLRVILRSSQQVTDTGLQTRIPAVGADLRLQRARLVRVRGPALNVCRLDAREQPRPRTPAARHGCPRGIPGWPRYHTCMGALQGYHRDRQKRRSNANCAKP